MKPSKTWKLWRLRILMIFAVIGPGFITANVDNDPNGIFTYSLDGARYGYLLLWTLIPTTIALIVVQEMSARMGAVTGKGSPTSSARSSVFGPPSSPCLFWAWRISATS
jgi:Mn2+ and Fe2+ transporters of the NRAMP family